MYTLTVGVFAQAETEAGTFLLSGATGLDFASHGLQELILVMDDE